MRGLVVKGHLLITSPLIVCLYSHAMKRFTHTREMGKDNIHTEGRREGGREERTRTCMYTHQHAHPSQLHNCEDVCNTQMHM